MTRSLARRTAPRPLLSTLVLAAVALGALGASAQQVMTVSQKNRVFQPRQVEVTLGETVVFVNDDGELLHHVYSKDAGFDIGEQAAGTRVPVRFARRGTFDVRCDIHPRMLLRVTVK